MTTVEVFTPAWCPAAYVEHDEEPEACRFAADVDWLAAHGVTVVRATLSDQPGRFVEHDAVRFLMNVLGPAVLPVVLVDGLMRWHGTYPTREQLAEWAGVQDLLAEDRAETALVHEPDGADRATEGADPSLAAVDVDAALRRFMREPAVPFVVAAPAAATGAVVPAAVLQAS